ncbi:MAG TPA: hypothetical protein VMW24_04205 [Sedimentisphaerales bacterium]|nr:hypothetical protein [Sedimentisphaerales bacterium]
MAIEKLETQMRKDEHCNAEATMRYSGGGNVCYWIHVCNEAYKKLGEPDVIKVTIEAVRLDDVR